MAKSKKNVSDLETIESYFTTDNEHHNKYTFDLYNEAKENELFTDLKTPLYLFDAATNEFYENRKKPLQTLNNLKATFKEQKLNKEQQLFILEHLIEYFENTIYYDEGGKNEFSLNQVAALLSKEYETMKPKNKYEYTPPKSKYNLSEVKKHIETLPDAKEKIKYLKGIKTDYLQNKEGWEFDIGTPFDEQIELEIKYQKTLLELETTPAQTAMKPQFKLSNRTGAKTDLIRVLHTLYKLQFFARQDEKPMNKEDFMKQIGQFFGNDFSNCDTILSQARKEQPLETNKKIFLEMIAVIEKEHYTSEEKRTKNK